jgi:hypothetical protein
VTTLALDISNYTSDLTPEALAAWIADGADLVIIQAVDPPAPFPPGKTRLQVRQCADAGLIIDVYVYLWFDLDASDIQQKLALLEGLPPIRRLWLDVEDTAAKHIDQVVCEAKVQAALDLCDAFPTSSGERTGIYCLTPEARVLTANLEWVPAGDLRVGTPIVAFDEQLGLMGAQRRAGRRWQPAIVTAYQRRQEPVFEVELADGRSLHATGEHQWIVTQGEGGHRKPTQWRRTDQLARRRGPTTLPRYFHPWQRDLRDYWSGFLAAAFDSEGCITSTKQRPAPRLSFAQRSNQLLAAVRTALAARGFQAAVDSIGKSGVHNIRIVGGLSEQLRFLGQMRPPRLLNNWANMLLEGGFQMEMRAIDYVPITAIRYAGEREIAAFSSSSGTYIAEGFGAHNTGRWFWADSAYMNDSTAFSDRDLWAAQYDGIADATVFTPFGGWT